MIVILREETINKSYIDHGMVTKPVEQISYIKLFILLSYVSKMVEVYPFDIGE